MTTCDSCFGELPAGEDATKWSGFRALAARYGLSGPLCEECCHEALHAAQEDAHEARCHGDYEPPSPEEAAETMRELGGF